MKVSLNWLTDYVDVSMPAAELGQLLTDIGLSLEEVIETETDIVLDLEVTANRPDCLGHLGVAREIAAVTGAEFRLPRIGEPATSGDVSDLASVEVSAPDLCPRYTARVIRGVRVGPSPSWMVERLEAVGLRSVNNVVDVTNYVLMEYSQPLHSFDYDKLAGRKIIVRRAKPGETLVSIDQTRCVLDETMLVIADAEKAVAIAGIMGGLDTEVGEGTTNLLIESAQFDPLATRNASRKLQLMSESNYRFERGVDPVLLEVASLRACQLILELAGGQLAGGIVDVWPSPWQPRKVELRPGRCDALLGVHTPVDRQVEILSRLGLATELVDGRIACTIPSHRPDLQREADLIEEVARIAGYDRIPASQRVTHPVASETLQRRARRAVGEAMVAAGFDEAISGSFINARQAELFGWGEPVRLAPGSRKASNVLRPTVLPSLLQACKTNQDAGIAQVSLFELANVFPPGPDARSSDEHTELGLVTTGDLRQLRGALETVLHRIDPQSRLDVAGAAAPGFAEGMAAEMLVNELTVGVMGIVAADVLDHYDLSAERPIAAAMVNFDVLLELAGRDRSYRPLPRFPAVKRDLSLVVDEQITWRQLAEAVEQVDQPDRVGIEYVTTYRGKQIPVGRKSVTFELTYRSETGTLRSEQVDQYVSAVVSALSKKLKGVLRT